MANTVDKVIKIAEAEVGYLEKSKSAYQKDHNIIYEKTKGAGYDNYTKYGKEMHDIYPSVMDFPAPYCDAFVDWCFQKSYGLANAKKLLAGNFDDYTVASAQLYKNKGAYYKTKPQVGDQIFFRNSTRICHTGIVYKVDSLYVYTIEGNTSSSEFSANGGCVAKKKYSLADSRIDGYGRPKYDVATSTTPTPTTFSPYKVKTTGSLNIRSLPSTNGSILGVLNPDHAFTIREEKDGWGRVYVIADSNKKEVQGWVSLKYTKRV